MRNVFVLLFIIILAIASLGGYLYLTDKITSGDMKIAEGEKQLEVGQQALRAGKAKLTAGKQKMARATRAYNQVNGIPFMGIVDKLPISSMPFDIAKKQIAEGSQLIAKGQGDVKAGEARLEEGKLRLTRGKDYLQQVNYMRIACAFGTFFFVILAIVLGFYWRRSLTKIFIRTG